MSKRHLLVVAVALASCGRKAGEPPPEVPAAAASPPLEAVAPDGFRIDVVWRNAGETRTSARMRIDGTGRPVLLVDGAFVPLRLDPSEPERVPFAFATSEPLVDALWTEDGSLLISSGRMLARAAPEGLTRILDLPAPMNLSSAGAGTCWAWEETIGRRLFLVDATTGVSAFLEAQEPIGAVAGTPERVYVAVGGALLRAGEDEGATLLYRGPEPIASVAVAGETGVFFSTSRGVFYLREDGPAWPVLAERATEMAVHGEDLFMYVEGAGVVRGHPVSSFASVTDR